MKSKSNFDFIKFYFSGSFIFTVTSLLLLHKRLMCAIKSVVNVIICEIFSVLREA